MEKKPQTVTNPFISPRPLLIISLSLADNNQPQGQTGSSWEPSLWSSSLCCAECWIHCPMCEIWISWGMQGTPAKKAWEERQRGPNLTEPETGSSLDWGSRWLSSKAITPLSLSPCSPPQWLFTKQEAKTPGWNNKGWTSLCVNVFVLSLNWFASP